MIPQSMIYTLNEEAHAVAKSARKSGDPRAAAFKRIASEIDALFSQSVPDAPALVVGANVQGVGV